MNKEQRTNHKLQINSKHQAASHKNKVRRKLRKFHVQRENVIDLTRAFAVFLMVITHVIAIAFDHKEGSSSIVFYIGLIGGIASFTTFLFLSGATSYITFIHLDNDDRRQINYRKYRIFQRSIQILIAYYFLATLSLFLTKAAFVSDLREDLIKDFFRIIFFLRVPEFTEFLLTLIAFSFSLLFFRRIYKKVTSKKRFLIPVMVLTFLVGALIYNLNFQDDRLNLIKALLAGHENLHTFPIFQYIPVYLVGIFVGRIFHNTNLDQKEKAQRIALITGIVFFSSLFSILIFSQTQIAQFNISNYESRFPPTIGFLLGSSFIALLAILFFKITLKVIWRFTEKAYMFVSKNAFSYFVIHSFLLLIFRYIQEQRNGNNEWRYSSLLEIFLVFMALVTLCTLIIFIRIYIRKVYLYLDKLSDVETFLVNKIMPIGVFALMFLTLAFALYDNLTVKAQLAYINPNNVDRVFTIEENAELWFDHDFKYARQINIGNLTDDQVFISKNWVTVTFNHSEIITKDKLKHKKGEDIRVVELEGILFKEIPIIIKRPNTEATQITFKFRQGSNLSYYLYYGNALSAMSEAPKDQSSVESAIKVNLGSTTEHSMKAALNRQWFLKDYSQTPKLTITIIPTTEIENIQSVNYKIEDIRTEGKQPDIENLLTKSGSNYKAQINVSDFKPGIYTIQGTIVEVTDQVKIYQTYKIPFYVSYPIYTSWTLDWEGWGVAQYELNDIINISEKYKMPLTHFFNPRIYVKEQSSIYSITPAAAQYFTNWVIDRKSKGDEIALHLHFYPDILKEIGIEVREDAKLIGIGRDETYIQAYTKEELDKILKWSLDKFREKGLGKPISFRSGAWMSGPQVLSALADNGFLLDSSGRSGGILNPAWPGSTKIPWNLQPTVKPYKPSVNDINKWEGERLNIWEFANNGADSYWFSAEELKNRFNTNYSEKNGILTRPQAVTYLSHPHGFTIYDSKKIRNLMDHLDNFLYTKDKGPAVYGTLENIYKNWNKETFFNGE